VQAVIVRDSSERWISCCKLRTEVASDIESGLMTTGEHFPITCAITYDVVFQIGRRLLKSCKKRDNSMTTSSEGALQ